MLETIHNYRNYQTPPAPSSVWGNSPANFRKMVAKNRERGDTMYLLPLNSLIRAPALVPYMIVRYSIDLPAPYVLLVPYTSVLR